jgi:hypothetical protein
MMGRGAEEINDKIDAGRRTIDLSRGDDLEEMEARRVPPVAVMAGAVAALVGLGVLGWMIYRSRQRRNLIRQIQDAIPDYVRDLPDYVRDLPDHVRDLPDHVRDLPGELRSRVKARL